MPNRTFNEPVSFSLFFKSAKDLFCIAGFDGYFKQINPAVVETLSFSEQELLSRPINSFVHPEDQVLTEVRRNELRQAKPLSNFENRYITKSGDIVWLAWTSVANTEQELVFAVAKNITLRKTRELERERTVIELNAEQEKLKELVYTALHDLRSPVANMISIFELFEDLQSPPAPFEESLLLLQNSINDLKNKMDVYLDRLIKSRNNTGKLNHTRFEEALQRVKATLSSLIAETDTEISADFSEAPEVIFDEDYLESILLNLITNSIKYAKPDVKPVIVLKSKDFDNTIELTVADNGRGFDVAAIGDKLFQVHQRFHPGTEGKGVGLYLVKSHLHNSGGDILVESQIGAGTKFILSFRKDTD